MGIPAVALAATVGGSILQAYSAYSQSKSQKAAYDYQAGVSRNNAQIAEWNAKDAARRGEQDLIAQQRKTANLMGAQRATLAGRGIDLSEGSALNILTDTDYFGQQDALTVKDNTAKSVWQARVQAANDSNNADMLKYRSDAENPLLSGGASLLTSAGRVASSWGYLVKSLENKSA